MTETKIPSNSRDDVLQFLETLDTYSQTNAAANPAAGTPGSTPADTTQSVLDFLDQITQSTPAPNPSESTSKQDSQSNASMKQNESAEKETIQAETQKQSGAWSWGGLLATATTAYQTASIVVDNSVKEALETVRTNEATKKLEERVRGIVNKEAIEKIGADLKTLSLSTLTTVVNAVVPPISQYEVVEVWLSHDMVGYVGLESLVYRAFMKVMEQVEGGDVVVRKSEEIKRDPDDESHKDLNVCEGFIEAVGLAKANIEQVIKKHYKPPQIDNENIKDTEQQSICPVFMAIQPTKANPYSLQNQSDTVSDPDQYLFYVIVLTDPTHNLTFKTFSQALPVGWLDIPYEENEWVEAKMVSVIKLAVQSIAQDYVLHRMTANDGQNQSNDDNSNIVS
ncbi:maintenance of telomere capping protein 1 [Gigaspora margarita]|uniref:Maintenance of telomere capping protein 1 n=1 Tax=Gigaspora margarita TaxID=4874 RepID=A0A8H4EIC4_GIGMA|nr:maintenance of telomere capping protein 1 [Gigaspora margarita]